MAVTTSAAFDQFKAKLLLIALQTNLVGGRRGTAAGYLASAFPASSDLPLRSTHLMGSAGRGTIIRPLDDVDVLAIFNNKDNIFDRLYRSDSQKFLYRVRDALNAYRVEVVGARGQAARLFYKAAPHVDIAPVFQWSGGGYALPNGSGGWLTTDPFAHDAWVTNRTEDLGSNLKPMVRMLKRWNNVHSKHLKGFHLEVVIGTVFSSLGNNSRVAREMFFKSAQTNLRVSDPAGHGGDLSTYMTSAKRSLVIANLERARARAASALTAESRGDHPESIRLWRLIFGDEFPAYG